MNYRDTLKKFIEKIQSLISLKEKNKNKRVTKQA